MKYTVIAWPAADLSDRLNVYYAYADAADDPMSFEDFDAVHARETFKGVAMQYKSA